MTKKITRRDALRIATGSLVATALGAPPAFADAPLDAPSAKSESNSATVEKNESPAPRERVVVKLKPNSDDPNVQAEIVGYEIADYRDDPAVRQYLMEDEDGALRFLAADQIVEKNAAPAISPQEARDGMKERLLARMGKGFDALDAGSFLFVSNAFDGYVEWCARLFERLEKGFDLYAEKTGLKTSRRATPLVAIIFARQSEFIRYASAETPSAEKLAAYYNMQTNRVALYDLSNPQGVASENLRRRSRLVETREILSRPNAAFNVATIVHEATHQLCFNRGVFLRTGPSPLWAAEGMALCFETPNGMATQGGWGFRGSFVKNERMLALYRAYAPRMKDPYRKLVAQEGFYENIEASYAASWALFYYLSKRRERELADYLNVVSQKSPCAVYPSEERLGDFTAIFGDDWDRLTGDVARYMKRL